MQKWLLVLCFLFPAVVHARTHTVPVASKRNCYAFRVINQNHHSLYHIYVKLTQVPSWISFDQTYAYIDSLMPFQKVELDFLFDVMGVQEETVDSFKVMISDAQQTFLQKKQIKIKAASNDIRQGIQHIYPNPSNMETKIIYRVASPARINISIHNILGQQIAILFDDVKMAGAWQLIWNGTNDHGEYVASGTYFVKYMARDVVTHQVKTSTMKLILQK